jgi:glucokinase
VSAPVVLGLDFGGSKIAVAVADLTGRRLASGRVQTEPSLGARWNLERGIAAARGLLGNSAPEAEVVAVGACTFGIPATYGIHLAPAIPGWGELSLGLELGAAFGTRAVTVATDVKAAAAAEACSGALVGHDPGLYLNLGTGLAVGIVCGGKIVAGANGAAGEIGYCLRRPADLELDQDERVVLEEVVSGMAVAAAGTRRTGEELSAADVFVAEDEDPRLDGALDDFVQELSFHLVNLTIALDPSRIAVGGGMARSWQRLEGPLKRALEAHVPYPPELVLGAYPFDAALVGAITLGVEAAEAVIGGSALPTDGKDGGEGGGIEVLRATPAMPARSASEGTNSENTSRSQDRGRV